MTQTSTTADQITCEACPTVLTDTTARLVVVMVGQANISEHIVCEPCGRGMLDRAADLMTGTTYDYGHGIVDFIQDDAHLCKMQPVDLMTVRCATAAR